MEKMIKIKKEITQIKFSFYFIKKLTTEKEVAKKYSTHFLLTHYAIFFFIFNIHICLDCSLQ